MNKEEMMQVEFVNLTDSDISPLIKKCEIKVFYLGENRNHSSIDKPTAMEMSKTLRGVPIVGWYSKEKADFRDHGEEIVINGDGIEQSCKTKPYGFVPTDAQVWFQDFFETDEDGYSVKRTYLVTTGFLWSGQFKEISEIFNNNSRGQSMELDSDTLQGTWTNDYKLFIINDATFSKLCILGDDVEPCFEGASVIPSKYNLSDNFKEEMRAMMKDFSLALEGGKTMPNIEQPIVEETKVEPVSDFTAEEPAQVEPTEDPAPDVFAKEEDEKKDEGKKEESAPSSDEGGEDKKEKEDEDEKKKYELLETEFSKLQEEYNALEVNYKTLLAENATLAQFKLSVENAKKDELIAKFDMLTDEEKADIVTNKEKYTLEDIEAKLSILYTRKNFASSTIEEIEEKKEEPITTFNLTEVNIPDWIKAVKSHRENN